MKTNAEGTTEESREVKPRLMEENEVAEEEEEECNLMTNTMSMSLLHLPPEMLTMVASYLDLSSYIALSKSCSLLLNTLAPHPEKWKVLLQNTKMGLGQLGTVRKAREAGEFLAFLENPDNKLILELFHKICAGNPAVSRTIPFVQDLSSLPVQELFNLLALCKRDFVSVSCPCQVTHEVTSYGFAILQLVEMALRRSNRIKIEELNIVSFKSEVADYLNKFAFKALEQDQMIESVELFSYRGGLESFELSAILQNTKKWRFEICFVDDPALVQVLSQEAERGKIGQLHIKDQALAKVKAGQLKKVWKITSSWGVMCSQCRKCIDVVFRYQGWLEMQKMIERVKRGNLTHYNKKGCKAPKTTRRKVTKSLKKYLHLRNV